MVITLVVLIAVFYFILPMTAILGMIGSSYFFIALVASIVISMFVSWGMGEVIK